MSATVALAVYLAFVATVGFVLIRNRNKPVLPQPKTPKAQTTPKLKNKKPKRKRRNDARTVRRSLASLTFPERR